MLEDKDASGKIVTVTTTGASALAYSLAPKTGFELLRFSLSNGTTPATSENLVVTVDSKNGAAYDTVIYTKDMNAVDDIDKSFDDIIQEYGDKITFAWTNTNTVTYGLTIKYRKIL